MTEGVLILFLIVTANILAIRYIRRSSRWGRRGNHY